MASWLKLILIAISARFYRGGLLQGTNVRYERVADAVIAEQKPNKLNLIINI